MLPVPPQKLQDERLYAKLYYAYLRACSASAPEPLQSSVRLTPTSYQTERKFEKSPAFIPKEGAIKRVCRHCKKSFPSGNALHVHLRNIKRAKLPPLKALGLRNNLNDPEDDGDPFLVVKNAEKKIPVPKLLETIEESRSETGVLPTGFIDMFFTGGFKDEFSIIEPPPNTFNPIFGDGKPKEKRNKFYIEAANQQLIDNDFISYTGASFGLPKEDNTTNEGPTVDSLLKIYKDPVTGLPLADPTGNPRQDQKNSLLLHQFIKNTTKPIPTSNTFAMLSDSDDIVPLPPRGQVLEDQQSRPDDDHLFDSD